jgi:hypothetical protein
LREFPCGFVSDFLVLLLSFAMFKSQHDAVKLARGTTSGVPYLFTYLLIYHRIFL